MTNSRFRDHSIGAEDVLLLKTLCGKLADVKAVGWSDESIRILLQLANNKTRRETLISALDIIIVYGLQEYDTDTNSDEEILTILRNSLDKDWCTKIHQIAIHKSFPGTYVKPLNELVNEICELNRDRHLPFLQNEKLVEEYGKIFLSYNNVSQLNISCGNISTWTKGTIQQWAVEVKNMTPEVRNQTISTYEMIAVVMRAVEITSRFRPRDVQLLALLILLNPEKGKGRLMQINTGEGKTTIIAMFAAIKALRGHTADVSTSSPELAKPQSEQQANFFSCFSLTVAHTEGDEKFRSGSNTYEANTIYGSAGTLQGDILRDEYHKLNIRKRRKFDVGIVDEVDSMLIDGKDYIVMLSSGMPALDFLEPLLAAIWYQLGHTADRIFEKNGITYYLDRRCEYDESSREETTHDYAVPLTTTKKFFLESSIEIHLRKMLRDDENLPPEEVPIPETYPKIEIPKHLRKFVIERQLIKWIKNAIKAKYECENGKDYIIRDQKIAPVDAANTGNVQLNMLWSDGLHQFLQLKHGSKICAESLTTNFISNVTFFKRYGENLYGVTGTLGSEAARELLHEMYNVDSIIIPPFQKKQFLELRPIIAYLEDHWYQNIINSSLIHLRNNRAVLIITKYIEEAKKIKKMFIEDYNYDASKIKRYVTDEDSKVVTQELKAGELIIATNIAGRGTDIKPSQQVEDNGGLHVCVTFLPINRRVDMQNCGRTSRTGNKGTAQFVLLEHAETNITDLKRIRDEQEEATLRLAKRKIQKVLVKDQIFQKFCKLLDEVNATRQRTKHADTNENVKEGNNISDKTEDDDSVSPSSESVNERRAVEERFGFWLKTNENAIDSDTDDAALERFEEFRSEILADAEKGQSVKNPFYYIMNGNQFLRDKEYDKAIKEYTSAIEMDENFVVNAYYYRAFARFVKYGNSLKRNKFEIETATQDLETAKRIIENILEPMLIIISSESASEALSEQVRHKRILLAIQKNTIDLAIGYKVDNFIEELESKTAQEGISPEETDRIKETIEDCRKNQEKFERGSIRQAIEADTSLEIKIKDITASLYGENIATYKSELHDYAFNGFIGYFQVAGRNPIEWFPVSVMAAVGLIQICAGACILAFTGGVGVYIGGSVIAHGVDDLITTVRDGIFERKSIDWKNWGFQKSVSLVVSIVCCGLGTMANIARRLLYGAKNVIMAGSVLAKQTVESCVKFIAQKIGWTLAEGIANELLDYMKNITIGGWSFKIIKDFINEKIKDTIRRNITENVQLQKMLEFDRANRNNYYQTLVLEKIDKLLSAKFGNNWWGKILHSAKGVLKHYGYNKSAYAVPVVDVVIHAKSFCELFPKWFTPTFHEIVNGMHITEESNENNERQVVQGCAYNNLENETVPRGDINLNLGKKPQEQMALEKPIKSADEFADQISDKLSGKITEFIKEKVIDPYLLKTRYLSDKLTKEFHTAINSKIQLHQTNQKIVFLQDNPLIIQSPFQNENYISADRLDALIEEVRTGTPTGLYYLHPLSAAAHCLLVVLDAKGKILQIISKGDTGKYICVEYHQETATNSQYWTLPGKKEPRHTNLFTLIAEVTDVETSLLRELTIQIMERNRHEFSIESEND